MDEIKRLADMTIKRITLEELEALYIVTPEQKARYEKIKRQVEAEILNIQNKHTYVGYDPIFAENDPVMEIQGIGFSKKTES